MHWRQTLKAARLHIAIVSVVQLINVVMDVLAKFYFYLCNRYLIVHYCRSFYIYYALNQLMFAAATWSPLLQVILASE